MGFLVDWGIKRLQNTETDLRRIAQVLGVLPLSWRDVVSQYPTRDGVMWRIPDPVVPRASSLLSMQSIIVSANELVMVMRDGKLDDQIVLQPDLYDVRQLTALRGRIEVIWCTTGEFQLSWGVGEVLTLEGEAVGAYGTYQVRVLNPVRFLGSVARNWQVYTKEQLGKELTRTQVISKVGGIFGRKSIRELQPDQAEIQLACKEALLVPFERWGLEFLDLTIEKINYPDKYLETLRLENRVTLEKQAQLTGGELDIKIAMLKAQEEQFRILTEANKIRALGNANVDVMQNQLNAGIDPLALEKIKAIEILAANPGEGMLIDNRPQIVNQLLPQPPVPPVGPVIVTGNPFAPSIPQQLNQANTLPTAVNATPPAGGQSEAMTREKIEEMLDKLDERFANGEISEQVYLTLQAKWQNRLEKLS